MAEEGYRDFIALHTMLCGQGFFLLANRIECGREGCGGAWIYRRQATGKR